MDTLFIACPVHRCIAIETALHKYVPNKHSTVRGGGGGGGHRGAEDTNLERFLFPTEKLVTMTQGLYIHFL